MQHALKNTKPKYLIDENGNKKAVVIGFKEYKYLIDSIEDFEDTIDLLKAEKEAISFTPYEEFRKTWLKA
ncbi:MAG: hypothetical protein WCQ90_04785 [Deltaproteobacteria bacterium]